jgi:hypothetical protein
MDDGFVIFKWDNFAIKGAPNPGPRQQDLEVMLSLVLLMREKKTQR